MQICHFFGFLPSHVGIEGNEIAEELAITSLSNKNMTDMNIKFLNIDFKQIVAQNFQYKRYVC